MGRSTGSAVLLKLRVIYILEHKQEAGAWSRKKGSLLRFGRVPGKHQGCACPTVMGAQCSLTTPTKRSPPWRHTSWVEIVWRLSEPGSLQAHTWRGLELSPTGPTEQLTSQICLCCLPDIPEHSTHPALQPPRGANSERPLSPYTHALCVPASGYLSKT